MRALFFPDPIFGWVFLAALAGFLVLATVADWRTMRIPKGISLGLLAAGLAFQLVRGAWLGSLERRVWLLGAPGPVSGALDALLFALAGAGLGFVLMLGLFAAGGCGGGDVKLFTAVGTWVGPWPALWVFVVAALVLISLGGVRFAALVLRGRAGRVMRAERAGRTPDRWMTYSFPLTVATLAVLFWFVSEELLVAP